MGKIFAAIPTPAHVVAVSDSGPAAARVLGKREMLCWFKSKRRGGKCCLKAARYGVLRCMVAFDLKCLSYDVGLLNSFCFARPMVQPEYTFCQERDGFSEPQCCSGTDGDPSESNVCAEGKGATLPRDHISGLLNTIISLWLISNMGKKRWCFLDSIANVWFVVGTGINITGRSDGVERR